MHHPLSYNGVGFYSVFDQPHIFDQRKGKPMIVPCMASGSNDKQADSKTRTDSNSQDEDQDSNKLWLIVRYMTVDNKTNEFKLTGGETIKIGRVKFTVREVHT